MAIGSWNRLLNIQNLSHKVSFVKNQPIPGSLVWWWWVNVVPSDQGSPQRSHELLTSIKNSPQP